MKQQPFFAILLMHLRFVAVPEMKKISTDGRCIYFSPNFIDKLYVYELDYLLCHEIMHIVQGDIRRAIDLQGDDYHLTCDIKLNAYLDYFKIIDGKYPHLGYIQTSVQGCRRDVNDLTTMEVYTLLPFSLYILDNRSRSKYLPDSDLCWNATMPDYENMELILDISHEDGVLRCSGRENILELIEK